MEQLSPSQARYLLHHVFMPVKLPQESDLSLDMESTLCGLIHESSIRYRNNLPNSARLSWDPVVKMLKEFSYSQECDLSLTRLERSFTELRVGESLALLIRAQNAGLIIRKSANHVTFESFEVSPPAEVVMGAIGKLRCSYPGPAISIPAEEFTNPGFIHELSSFLAHMSVDNLEGAVATTKKAGSTVVEERDTAHPRYITELLTGILRGMGTGAQVTRISKRISDDVVWNDARTPWRRSSTWLVLRVALQTTLYRPDADHHRNYKSFLLFFFSELLQAFINVPEFPSEDLYMARAKLSRRLYKLGAPPPIFIATLVRDVTDDVEVVLRQRWLAVQESQSFQPLWAPETLDLEADTCLQLKACNAYLAERLLNAHKAPTHHAFTPPHLPRTLVFGNDPQLVFQHSSASDTAIALADFEQSVVEGIDSWVIVSRSSEQLQDACELLEHYITSYSCTALDAYENNPEHKSFMLLTLLDLWVALDKLSCEAIPLLLEYLPEVPLEKFNSLLLREKHSMSRLSMAQDYIQRRNHKARFGSVFNDKIGINSFSVRYFKQSPTLKSLQDTIEADAGRARAQKRLELIASNAKHAELLRRINGMDHDNFYDRHQRQDVHRPKKCARCSLERQANGMKISVHEWPLPEQDSEAKLAVFESCCPPIFAIWRTVTYQILFDLCSPKRLIRNAKPAVTLNNYSSLSRYFKGKTSRISIASSTKPFSKAHYKDPKIPSVENNVLVNNGLTYRLFDKDSDVWAADPFGYFDISAFCTLLLPSQGPYSKMQDVVSGTEHTPNDVIARQFECPKEHNLHEFMAFGTLRSGPRLQWMNIAREIRSRTLNLQHLEVHILILQAIFQVGPSVEKSRESHLELLDTNFCLVLLAELQRLLTSVASNWQEVTTVRTILAITSRVLEFAEDDCEIGEGGCRLLREARGVVEKWMDALHVRLQSSQGEAQVSEFQLRLCEVAATCRATYDVHPRYFARIFSSSQDIALFVRSAVVVHDNTPLLFGVSNDISRLLDRNRRLARRSENFLHASLETPEGLHIAMEIIWGGYARGRQWEKCGKWYTTCTPLGIDNNPQTIHLDILEGKLLIDGKPLGRLPKEITQHSLYERTFGKMIFDVVPANMPGMEFSTRTLFFGGCQIYFAYHQTGNHIVIRAKKGTHVFELVPHQKLVSDFPAVLVGSYAHWLDLSNGEMEFRPLGRQWEASPLNWTLRYQVKGGSKMTMANYTNLIDVYSKAFAMLSSRVKPLEYPENVIITYSCDQPQAVVVNIPRFRLSFAVNADGHLESKNILGMCIDERRNSGTLIGLRNQLLLRPLISPSQPCRVLIPQGVIEFSRSDDHHVLVDINTRSDAMVHFHEYRIDTDLGRLVGDATLSSHLYVTYLHGLTSHCLPDPLTGCTGTEHALSLVNSATSRSFQKLTKPEIEMLQAIGHLTPRREWYPAHLKRMQKIEWRRLPALSQHQGFETAVTSIVQYGARLNMFYPDNEGVTYDGNPFPHLMHRASHRESPFLSQDLLSYEPIKDVLDTIHRSRDLSSLNSQAESSAKMSRLVYTWPTHLPTETDLYGIFCSWSTMSGAGSLKSLSYCQRWLASDFISRGWMSLFELIRHGARSTLQPVLMFSLSAAAFSGFYPQQLLSSLLAFAICPEIRRIDPPSWSTYNLDKGYYVSAASVTRAVNMTILPFGSSPEFRLPRWAGETTRQYEDRRRDSFNARVEAQEHELVKHFVAQWPLSVVTAPRASKDWGFNLEQTRLSVSDLFHDWWKNKELQEFADHIQGCLDRMRGSVSPTSSGSQYKFSPFLGASPSLAPVVTLARLFSDRDAPLQITERSSPTLQTKFSFSTSPRPQLDVLKTLFTEFLSSPNRLYQHYGEDLERSRLGLKNEPPRLRMNLTTTEVASFEKYERDCRSHFCAILASVQASLGPTSVSEQMILAAGLWPRCTARQLLGSLSSRSGVRCSPLWKRTLVALCLALMWYQRSQRLLAYMSASGGISDDQLFKELENAGYNSEDMQSVENVEWLLIQVDNDFLMRQTQADVTKEMISPTLGQNAATQLNMGEGKSSVIIPMVSTTLGDGDKLVRVVVLKPLASQMFHLLVERVSGLANQRVFYLPFSRGFDMSHLGAIQSLFEECARVGGVLVIQPEHILSLKLMTIHQILDTSSAAQTRNVFELQRWLEQRTRDVLDESDEILHVRYQMVYTVGHQQAIEDQPDRWTTTQQVLGLIKRHILVIAAQYPDSVEVSHHPNEPAVFPHIRLTDTSALHALVSLVVADVIAGRLDNLSFERLSPEGRQAARAVLTQHKLEDRHIKLLTSPAFKDSSLFNGLLLLRGLLLQGILAYAFSQRRWRVDYGLHPSRTLLAVPYRAKDVPSPRAEFGHPDVAIVLTCLSYYFGGLSDGEVDLCFNLLLQLDNPELEYERWTYRGTVVPLPIATLSGVNLKDPAQVRDTIRPTFRVNHAVIDFYLSQVVFPKAAKEFPNKLSTSAWDLAEVKHHPTTDPLQQLGTNAQVLSYLLQPENNFYFCMQPSTGGYVVSCLDIIVKEEREIRVLLDVGAQMLDKKNQELASHWLHLRPPQDVDAVVFFGEDDEKYVITRDGTVSLLVSSPFRRQLDRCLLYLDDAHTRGTDFKLPKTWRAAVTLGPGVTKDRLVQGCMRMRQLGLGQSVVFIAPLEIDRSIRKTACKADSETITSCDILHWSMQETCRDIEHHLPHWAHQGLDYHTRNAAWQQTSTANTRSLRSAWLQPEARSLSDMYGFESDAPEITLQRQVNRYPALRERCTRYGVSFISDTKMEEEQEREVSHEIERERQIERPRKATPAQHSVDKNIRTLVNGGSIPNFSSAFESVYLPWNNRLDSHWKGSPTLLATKDFLQVIQGVKKGLTEYLRPVTWIMSFTVADTTALVLLSPYEVNELLPAIRKGRDGIHLHVYSPRVTEATGSFEDLDFYCIPRLPWSWRPPAVGEIVQLNLWAGQLYLQDYENYLEVCRFLGLYLDTLYQSSNTPLGLDGFVRREHRTDENPSWFIESPVPLLKELFGLRRKGQSFLKTHMGKILHGKTLKRDDF